jgi:hypothetical protein
VPRKKFAADQVLEQRRFEAVELSNKADSLDQMADVTIEPEKQKQYRQKAEEYRKKASLARESATNVSKT